MTHLLCVVGLHDLQTMSPLVKRCARCKQHFFVNPVCRHPISDEDAKIYMDYAKRNERALQAELDALRAGL